MFNLVLYEPQIAPNTGNIIRLVANNGCFLHLIEPLGFDLSEKKLRRAGLDYHDLAQVKTYENYQSFLTQNGLEKSAFTGSNATGAQIFAITTKGAKVYSEAQFRLGDFVLFGSETSGLPDSVMADFPQEKRLVIPMREGSRSLNLSNAAAIISYEALRQHSFKLV